MKWTIPAEIRDTSGQVRPVEFDCAINMQVVMQGHDWKPGLVVSAGSDDPDLMIAAETIVYAYNEGSETSGLIEEEDGSSLKWDIPPALLQVMEALHDLPKGTRLQTEDGYVLTLQEGVWTDGDMTFDSLDDLDADFVLLDEAKPKAAP